MYANPPKQDSTTSVLELYKKQRLFKKSVALGSILRAAQRLHWDLTWDSKLSPAMHTEHCAQTQGLKVTAATSLTKASTSKQGDASIDGREGIWYLNKTL